MEGSKQILIAAATVLLLFASTVFGDTWTNPYTVTYNAGNSSRPAIAAEGSNLYLVWQHNTGGTYQVFFKRSVDEGLSWTGDKRLTGSAGNANYPAIAVHRSNVYLVWQDDAPGRPMIHFARSTDRGITWKTTKQITSKVGGSCYPAIAVDGTNIYVVWHDWTPGNAEIYFKRSIDGGLTWAAEKRLTNTSGGSYYPAIAVDGANIYVVWEDWTPGNAEIYFKGSIDRGLTWTANKRLTTNATGSYRPAISVEGSNINVVWHNETPQNHEIYSKRSVNGGLAWDVNKRLTSTEGQSLYPAVAAEGSNLCLVYSDDTTGSYKIYFKRSADTGATWAVNRRLSSIDRNSTAPTIAVDGETIYVVWQTEGRGLYLKRGIME